MLCIYGTASYAVGFTATVKNLYAKPTLISPADNSTNNALDTSLVWNTVDTVNTYDLIVATDEAMTTIMMHDSTLVNTDYQLSGLENETEYFWKVRSIYHNNAGAWSDIWSFVTSPVVSTDDEKMLPEEFSLSQNYPNPFNPSTTINYTLAKDTEVKLSLYSVTGQRVVELMKQKQPTGYYTIHLNMNSYGLPSGVYFYQLNTPEFQAVKKLMFIK